MNDLVKIRMYNVGFGDCFLFSACIGGKTSKVLFDCGSIKAGPLAMEDVVQRVVADVRDDDGVPRIAVIVATHRHKDHVSGFANNLWKTVGVKEVWMPWTESPSDPDAAKIRGRQNKLAAALVSVGEQRRTSSAPVPASPEDLRLTALSDLALNALSNEAAMGTLHDGFDGRPVRRFLPSDAGDERTFQTPALPGIKVHVLGPSRDLRVIKDMDPPLGQSYLQLLEGIGPGDNVPDPFREDWWMETDFDPAGVLLSVSDRQKIGRVGYDLDFNVAMALDKAVNGTSLMLALEIGGALFLFPGDAQWGTWQAALENPRWQQLLKKTTFYKVGHHGSHNATPVEFVENTLGNDFWAMVSTSHVQQWPFIPKEELLAALEKKCGNRIARTDNEKATPAGYKVEANQFIELEIPI